MKKKGQQFYLRYNTFLLILVLKTLKMVIRYYTKNYDERLSKYILYNSENGSKRLFFLSDHV